MLHSEASSMLERLIGTMQIFAEPGVTISLSILLGMCLLSMIISTDEKELLKPQVEEVTDAK